MAASLTRTWDDQRLKRDRIALLQAEMRRQGIGALLLSDGVHRRYVLNLDVPGAKVFVPLEGEPLAFVRPRDMGFVQLQHANVQPPLPRPLRGLAGPVDGESPFARVIAECMARYGLARQLLGIDTLGVGQLIALTRSDVRITDAEPVIERAWCVKTDDEIAIYRAIGAQYVATLSAFRDAVRPAVSEKDLAAVATFNWLQWGGEDIAQLNVCSGENMNPWRRWPTDRVLQDGDLVGIDLHGRGTSGLRGDASTTFFVGHRPPQAQRDLYRCAYDYLQGAIPAFRAGRSIAEAMAAVPRVPDRYRAQFHNYNIAHGIGMGNSGYPHMDPQRDPIDDVLRLNQVLAVECYLGEVGSSLAVKLEEQIVVRDGEPEVLGPIPVDERLVS